MQHGFQRLHGCAWATGQVENQAAAEGSGDGAAQRGHGRMFQAFAAHSLAKPLHNAFAYRAGSFGRDVPRGNSGSAGCNNESRPRSLLAQCGCNLLDLIGNEEDRIDEETRCAQAVRDRWTGKIVAQSLETGVAHSNDNSGHMGDFTFPELDWGSAGAIGFGGRGK